MRCEHSKTDSFLKSIRVQVCAQLMHSRNAGSLSWDDILRTGCSKARMCTCERKEYAESGWQFWATGNLPHLIPDEFQWGDSRTGRSLVARSRHPSVLARPCLALLLRLAPTPQSPPHRPWWRWLFLRFSQAVTFLCQDRNVIWLLSQILQGVSSASIYAWGGQQVQSG